MKPKLEILAGVITAALGWGTAAAFAWEGDTHGQPREQSTSSTMPWIRPIRIANLQQEEPPVPAPDFDPREEMAPQPELPSLPAVEQPGPETTDPCRRPCVALAEESEEPFHLFPQNGFIKIHGWLSGGLTFNDRRTSDRFNGPVTFNDRHGEFQMNQLYTVIERPLQDDGLDIGGRVDLLFGTDYVFTQSAGLETRENFDPHWNSNRFYGLAMPQLFGEIGNQDLSLKAGHFYTIIGYEVVPAIDNFFYSHAYTMQYGEPFTHTGGLVTWHASDNWTLTSGIVDGWDKFDPLTSRASYLGGAAYTPSHGQYSLAFSLITGDEDGAAPPVDGNRTMYSFVFSWDRTADLQYVFQHDYGVQSLQTGADAQWYGVNQYLFYTLSDTWKAGLRAEWFRDDDGLRVAGVRPGNNTPGGHAGNFYNITAGLNWNPHANLTFRPETRWDWFDGTNAVRGPYDGRDEQFTVGLDAIMVW